MLFGNACAKVPQIISKGEENPSKLYSNDESKRQKTGKNHHRMEVRIFSVSKCVKKE